MSTSQEYDRLEAIQQMLRDAIDEWTHRNENEVIRHLCRAETELRWLLHEKEDQLDNE